MSTSSDGVSIAIRPLAPRDSRACAEIMATSEPWLTLGRDVAASLGLLGDEAKEVYVAVAEGADDPVGFVILDMRGAFAGYIQSVAVREDWRGRGLGTALIAHAEQRVFRDSPHVFMCVSSFNGRARALYERLGYEAIGELRDQFVRGHSEWLLRKSLGPLADWTSEAQRLAFDARRESTK